MQKMKVNDYCEFPESLNMEPYTQEGLARRERITKKEEQKGDEEEDIDTEPKYPLELYDYKLSGVLVHSGYAEGGHYYSFIKDREDEEGKDKWYEFNDELVKEFDKEDLESECFGGEEKWSDMMGHSIYLKNSEKHRNAYVVLYERVAKEDIPYPAEENEEAEAATPAEANKNEGSDIQMASENEEAIENPSLKRTLTAPIKIPEEISEIVLEENRKYWQYKFLFPQEYSDFILEFCSLWNTKNMVLLNYDCRNRDYNIAGIDEAKYKEELKKVPNTVSMNYSPNKNIKFYPEKTLLPGESVDIYQKYGGEKVDVFEFEIFKLITMFYITVKQRASYKEAIPDIMDLIKAHLNKSLKACKWLITQFSNNEILAENFFHCPVADMRKLVAGLIYCAMIRVYEDEKDLLDNYWQYKAGLKDSLQRCYIGNFINLLLANFKEARVYTEYNSQYFSLISRFASLGQEARLYLLKAKVVGRIMDYYLQDASPFTEFFADYSDLNFEENENVEIGFPTKLENGKLSMWEELFMRKRDAQISDAAQDYTFVFETLSLCLRSCVLRSPDSNTFVDDLRYTELHENELALLKMDEKDIMGIIEACHHKISVKHLGSILLHLMHENPEFDMMLRNILVQGINDKQLEDLKPYFPIFKRYIMVQDSHTEERMNESIREYFNILKNNVKFVSFMAKFTTFLVKLCNMSRGVSEILASCPEEWEWIIEWINKTPCPTNQANPNYKNHAREIATSHYKQKRLQDIRTGKIETYEDEYDSDDDVYNHKFYKDQKIDYKHLGKVWVTAEVMTSLDEMMYIHYVIYNQQKAPWCHVEDENIAPYMAMQGRHDTVTIEANRAELDKQNRKVHQEESGSQQHMSESDRYSAEVAENENESVSD